MDSRISAPIPILNIYLHEIPAYPLTTPNPQTSPATIPIPTTQTTLCIPQQTP